MIGFNCDFFRFTCCVCWKKEEQYFDLFWIVVNVLTFTEYLVLNIRIVKQIPYYFVLYYLIFIDLVIFYTYWKRNISFDFLMCLRTDLCCEWGFPILVGFFYVYILLYCCNTTNMIVDYFTQWGIVRRYGKYHICYRKMPISNTWKIKFELNLV